MKLKDCMLVTAAIALLASCNNAGSDKETTDTTTTSYDNTTDNTRTTTYSSVEVPANTRTVFVTKYPSATNVTWYRYDPVNRPIEWEWSGWPMLDTSDYAARFTWEGKDYWAWYDDKGDWVGTVNVIADPTTLPSGITAAIKLQYPGYTITSASMENDKNRNAYEISLDKGGDKVKLLVDENGKIMKKKTVTGDMKTKEKPIKDSM